MTADEIRKFADSTSEEWPTEWRVYRAQLLIQAEIAAQLCELNEHFHSYAVDLAQIAFKGLPVSICATNDDIPVRIRP